MTAASLRSQVLRGGAYLGLRHGLGTLLSVGGILLLTRTIGPHAYGVYAAAMGFFLAIQLVAQLGVSVFLIRRADASEPDALYWTASTLALVLGLAGALTGVLLLPFLQAWTRIPEISAVALVLYATLPLTNLAQIPLARMERALEYRGVARVELAGQILFFAVALPLAFTGWGAWAPAVAWCAQQLLLVALTHTAARYRPRLHWDGAIVRSIALYGTGYTGSLWLYQLRKLVNPLVVGRFLGAEAVGVVAVTMQIATHLSFMAVATSRLAVAALSRVQAHAQRLNRAITEGMLLQALAVGPFLVLFAWIAPVAVPQLLGEAWLEITRLFPFVAVALLVNALFSLHSSALYVLRMNGQMALFHTAQTMILAAAALFFVPKFGLVGYGVAELAATVSYLLLHASLKRAVGAPAYARALAAGSLLVVGVSVAYLGLWGVAALAAITVLLQPWREVSGVIADLRSMAYE